MNRNHGAGWLAAHAAEEATHYLRPVMVHNLEHRPEFSPHWRCALLLIVRDDQEIFSLLDVLPTSFESLPETLDATTKREIARRLDHDRLTTQAEWADQHTAS